MGMNGSIIAFCLVSTDFETTTFKGSNSTTIVAPLMNSSPLRVLPVRYSWLSLPSMMLWRNMAGKSGCPQTYSTDQKKHRTFSNLTCPQFASWFKNEWKMYEGTLTTILSALSFCFTQLTKFLIPGHGSLLLILLLTLKTTQIRLEHLIKKPDVPRSKSPGLPQTLQSKLNTNPAHKPQTKIVKKCQHKQQKINKTVKQKKCHQYYQQNQNNKYKTDYKTNIIFF